MTQVKPEDIMASYPTTNNNIESFHSTFAHAAPRKNVPLYLGVSMAYHFATIVEAQATAMEAGRRKPPRDRGLQGKRRRLAKDLVADEFIVPPPENARRLQPRRVL
jgi:hypothetical protein